MDEELEQFGRRLREERKKLKMRQAAFAEACGVKKTTQFNYEKGTREPTASYLLAAAKQGVDTLYLVTGKCAPEPELGEKVWRSILLAIVRELGLSWEELQTLYQKRLQFEKEGIALSLALKNAPAEEFEDLAQHTMPDFTKISQAIAAWLSKAAKPEACLDLGLLGGVLAELDARVSATEKKLPPETKARLAIMLYRLANASGGVDQKTVDEALKLTA